MPPPDARPIVSPMVGQARFEDAIGLHRAGRLDEAAALYRWVAEHFPDQPDAFHLQGVIALSRGDAAGALALIEQAVRLDPRDAAYAFNRAAALTALGRDAEAAEAYGRALTLRPDWPEAWANRAALLRGLGRFEEALGAYDRALTLRPEAPESHFNRSIALLDLDRPDEALAAVDRALALAPGWAAAHGHRGWLLRRLKRLAESLASHDRALALDPAFFDSRYNRALTLQDLKRLPEAVAGFEAAIALRPEAVDPQLSRAAALLMQGDFERGWPAYESRWGRPMHRAIARDLGRPLWLGGEPLEGRTILLHAEQGLGDSLHFARYAALVAARGARVVLEVQAPLAGLMRTLKGVSAVIARGDPLPDFDLHAPLLSLPLAFGTTLDTLPAVPAYLAADPAKAAAWAERLGPRTAPRVGLVWSGNPAQDNDRNRSVALGELLPFLPEGIDYVSLQTEVRERDRAALAAALERGRVRHFGQDLADFTDTAALASGLDAVLSVCTSGAHLAGALGLDTRVLLAHAGTCWRWLTDRADSPWYPSMRLYRQGEDHAWPAVFQRAGADLAALRRR
jgi:tetratricopeptide (TPR) repeat protein